MFLRASVVLLLVLNLGVAAWWVLRAPAPVPAAAPQDLGVARLQLASEHAAARVKAPATPPPAPSPVAVAPKVAPTPAPEKAAAAPALDPAAQCYTFGPFASDEAAQHGRELLQAVATRVVSREQRSTPPRGWRVVLPPAASLDEAQATAQRIAAAGFSDYFIVRQGDEANSIALGRYRNEESAKRRAQSLVAAGFAARAEPLGDARGSQYLDVVAGKDFDPARAQAAVVVPLRKLDCARMP